MKNSEGPEIRLVGLDGSNPLAFLAALGTMRTLTLARPDSAVRMYWRRYAGAWRPMIQCSGIDDADGLVATVAKHLLSNTEARIGTRAELSLGKNLSIDPETLRKAAKGSQAQSFRNDRRFADFITSFGCEAFSREVGTTLRVSCTDFHFIFGSGHQNYLETAQKLLSNVREDHIHHALFEEWAYRDPRLSFRWDPNDAKEHAYQWTSPGDETTTTVWGANLLAFEATPFFPTIPTARGVATTGFQRHSGRMRFIWPIWGYPITPDVMRSLLSLSLNEMDRKKHLAFGICEVFSSTKIKIGEGANFKWSFTPAQAI